MPSYNIVETFYSIQGEGKFAGTAAYFIRFFGCNLACNFGNGFVCDDKAHSNKKLVIPYTADELVTKVKLAGAKHVVLTGGEISLGNVNPLIKALQEAGMFVQVETNGNNYDAIKSADYITYSPKGAFDKNAPEMKAGFHELKLLAGVNNPVDIEKWATVKTKYVQPIGNEHSWDMDNVNYCIEFVKEHPEWKLSLQTHKVMGVR